MDFLRPAALEEDRTGVDLRHQLFRKADSGGGERLAHGLHYSKDLPLDSSISMIEAPESFCTYSENCHGW